MIVLVGFMGAGKTTVGAALAERLQLPFADSDQVIESRCGVSVRELFASSGEAAFRDFEHTAVAAVLAGDAGVVSLGGGALGDPRTVAALAGHRVVHLEVSLPVALARVGGDEGRPMLAVADLGALYEGRIGRYREAAAVTVDADADGTEPVVDAVLVALGQ